MIIFQKLFILSLVIPCSVQQNTKSIFNCEIIQKTYRYFADVHSCRVREHLNVHQENVQLVLASHQVYVNIPGFSIVNKSIFYLPKGIEIFFPNLEILEIIQSGLKKITAIDLEHFEKLKYLDLSGNSIQILEVKIFQFNSKLEILTLNDNEISTVDQLAFYGLYNLKFLGFQRNSCFSDMTKDANAVQNMIEAIKFSCSEVNNRHSKNLENIKKEVDKYGSEISNLKAYLVNVIEENKIILNSFDAHNIAVEDFRSQLLEMHGKLENTVKQQIASMENKTQGISANTIAISTTNKKLERISSSCNQNVQKLATNITGINAEYQKISANFQDLKFIAHSNYSIFSNTLNVNLTDLLSYLLISNITLIILFCAMIIYLCCTRKSQNNKPTVKPLRIQSPTYRQLIESPNQTPLPTPLNLYHDTIYGQYEYINESAPTSPAFEDFYSEAVQSSENVRENNGSASYAAVYRQERY